MVDAVRLRDEPVDAPPAPVRWRGAACAPPGQAPAPAIGARLRDGSVPIDADGGWLHDIAVVETHVVAPACSDAFAAGRDLAAATVRDRVVRLPALTARLPVPPASRPEPERRRG